MPDPTFTAAPAVVPSRASPSTFSALTDPFIAWEKTFRNELSSSIPWFADAIVSATAAIAAADEVATAGGAALHNPAASYTIGDAAISNVNLLVYRANTSTSGPAAPDPSASGDWTLVGFSRAYADLTGLPTLGTAAALNVGTAANNVVQLGVGGALPAVNGAALTGLPKRGLTSSVKTVITGTPSQVDIALPTGKGPLLIEGRGITLSTSARLRARTSVDGSTFPSGSTDYRGSSDATQDNLNLTETNTGTLFDFFFTALGARDSTAYFRVFGNYYRGAESLKDNRISVMRNATGAVSHLRLYPDSGTFTGGEIHISQMLET